MWRAVVGASAVVLAGCGGSDRPTPTPPPRFVPSAAPYVGVRADLVGVRPADVDAVYGTPDARELVVVFTGGNGDCGTPQRVDLAEDATTVRVGLHVGSPPGKACADVAVQRGVAVTLEEPLGTRRVIDTARGVEVDVS